MVDVRAMLMILCGRCNEGSANGKQGGIWLDPCLEFKINPNPDGY